MNTTSLSCTHMNELEKLKQVPELEQVPSEELNWLLSRGEIFKMEPGEMLFEPEKPADHLYILLEGGIEIFIYQKGQKADLGQFEAPFITGVLPFSRMEKASGNGIITSPTEILQLHRKDFPDLVAKNYNLAAALVQSMTSRVRNFTSLRLQNEKLMALGKISAGLAHELNNPAAAIVRSASELHSHLKHLPEGFKKVILVDIKPEAADVINDVLYSKINSFQASELSVMERSNAEDEISTWLEDHGMENGYELAPELVEFAFDLDDLEKVLEHCPKKDLPVIITWIVNNLSTEKMVNDIQEASRRISELVTSVKSYTHMDQAQSKQEFSLQKSLRTTLTMLGHKLRKNKVSVDDSQLLPTKMIMGYPGQINQVFTNIIDNALDAMENGGRLKLISQEDDSTVTIIINDSGPGIPLEVQSKIFDSFFTTKELGKGTGMGLEVVLKLMEMHKAKIELESEPGSTSFKLIFPKKA